jgi:hypothetical protein
LISWTEEKLVIKLCLGVRLLTGSSSAAEIVSAEPEIVDESRIERELFSKPES